MIIDNIFADCQFEQIEFIAATLEQNEFNNSVFDSSNFEGSVTSFNRFDGVKINHSVFGNCTINYNIMHNCNINESTINVETLGAVFGITPRTLYNNAFMLLGNKIEKPIKDIESVIRKSFIDEGRYIEAFVFDVCHRGENIIKTTDELILRLKNKIESREYILGDELTFIFNIFKELYRNQRLPFIALARLCRSIGEIIEFIDIENKYYENYVLTYNNLYLLQNSMLYDISKSDCVDLTSGHEPAATVKVKLVFQEAPKCNVCKTIDQIYEYIYNEKPPYPTRLIATESGSYIEIISLALLTLFSLNLGLVLLNGSIRQLSNLRSNVGGLLKKSEKKHYLITQDQSKNGISKELAKLILPLIAQSVPVSLLKLENNKFWDNLIEILPFIG
jgi:hypothetical protein